MEALKVILRRAKETKNTVRYEESDTGEPPGDRHALRAEVGRPSPRGPGGDHGHHRAVLERRRASTRAPFGR